MAVSDHWEKTEGQTALEQADETEQHFWTDADGAHISSTGDHDTSGFHQLLTSVKNAFMHGTTELATFGENLIELGKNSTSAVIKFCAGTGEIGVIDSMLTLFADKVGVKGNSQAVLASNGESNVAAGKTNTTYTGLSQTAATAPSTDADPATALLQAKCTRNSDSAVMAESYINLTAKPDGTAPATVKASDIEVLSSRETNPYISVKNNANTIYTVPVGKTIAMTTRDSYGRPSDGGIGFDGTNVSLGGVNVVVNGETKPFSMLQNALANTSTSIASGVTFILLNGVRIVSINTQATISDSWGSVLFGSVPSEFAPPVDVFGCCTVQDWQYATVQARVLSDGQIQVANMGGSYPSGARDYWATIVW